MPILPSIGTVTYNGITFDASYRSRVSQKFVYDEAGRTITYSDFEFSLEGIIYADATVMTDYDTNGFLSTDNKMLNLQQSLSHPGKPFKFIGNGFGGMNINVTTTNDVAYGPKPQILELYPLGARAAWHVVFKLQVGIPMCSNAVYSGFVMEWNYQVGYDIDEFGYTTYTYSGHIVIPANRLAGGNQISDTVDAYREQICPNLMPGYIRKQKFTESLDKRRLDFVITDTQFPGDLPASGFIDAKGSMRVENINPVNPVRFQATISGEYTLAPTADRKIALTEFMQLVSDRLDQITTANAPILQRFTSTESIYSRPYVVSFEATYTFLSNLKDFITTSGQFLALSTTDWNGWAANQDVKKAMSPRGQSGLGSNAYDDVIIDLCGNEDSSDVAPQKNPTEVYLTNTSPSDLERNDRSIVIDSQYSWVDWQNSYVFEEVPGTMHMKALPIVDSPVSSMSDMRPNVGMGQDEINPEQSSYPGNGSYNESSNPPDSSWGANGSGNNVSITAPASSQSSGSSSSSANPELVQQRSSSSYRIYLEGFGMRAGYGVPVPRIKNVGTCNVVEEGTGLYEINRKIGQWGGVPIYMSRWKVTYIMDSRPPAQIPVLYDPSIRENN